MIQPTPAQLSELIGSIYDRAIDPGAWSETLARMRVALDAEIAGLILTDVRNRKVLLSYSDNIPDDWMERILRNPGEVIEVWGGAQVFMSHPVEEPVQVIPAIMAQQLGRNSYADEAVARGFIDGFGMFLARDDHVVGGCLFGRRGTERFGEPEFSLVRLLLPHAQRAIAFSRMFELATLRADAFEAALNAVAVPTILVSEQAELIHANAAGQAELDRGESLRLHGKRIQTADLAHQVGLTRALETARRRPDADPRNLNISLNGGSRQLKLLPLPRNSVRGMLAPAAAAAICMSGSAPNPARDDARTAELLMARHDLTKAEAAVALEIAKGDGRAAAAARLGIRENTARTHLSSIFLKLNINRQAQLVRLIDRGLDAAMTPNQG